MSGRYDDFTAYVVARWPQLVAGLCADGVPPERAEEAVARTLATLRPGWRRLVRDTDVEVLVWRGVREEAGLATPADALPPLGADPAAAGSPVDPFAVALAGSRDAVGPLARVTAEVGRRRRRSVRVGAVTAVVLGLLTAVGAWWVSRPAPPEVVEMANPVPVPWYAEGRLHLAEVVVTLPGVTELAPTAEGAVVRRGGGTWWEVDGDGDVDRLDEEPAALDRPSEPPPVSPGLELGVADRVVDGVVAPGGVVVHLLDNALAGASYGTYVRLSETGRTAFVVCREEGRVCDPPRLATTSEDGVLLR